MERINKYTRRIINKFSLSIRKKLMLVLLVLLIVPLLGYQDIRDMETFLREEQETVILENAQIIASVLQSQPTLFDGILKEFEQRNHLYIRPLKSNIQLDGYADDWNLYRDRIQTYRNKNIARTEATNHPMLVDFRVGNFKRNIYLLFQITDDKVVYRKANNSDLNMNDHVVINMETAAGDLASYALSTFSPGRINAYKIHKIKRNQYEFKPEKRITAYWQEGEQGYNIEVRIPLSMLGNKLGFSIVDVDNKNSREIVGIINTANSNDIDGLGTVVIASPELKALLKGLERRNARIWVLDHDARVIARAGELVAFPDPDNEVQEGQNTRIGINQIVSGLIRLLYKIALTQPATEFVDDLSNASRLSGEEVIRSLRGLPATQWRKTPDHRVNILRATYPIRIDNMVVGAIAVEETSNSILILQNRAIEILVNLSVAAFFIATISLLLFTSRLSLRIRRLRDDAEQAISADGKVQGVVRSSSANDEVGDLARSFASILDRLSQYNKYLETMAGKLSHELRTPITVVRSSLENLESSKTGKEDNTYIDRAREGIDRLANILTRMSEATRLEQTLQQEEKVTFNIEEVINGCVRGYQIAHDNRKFIIETQKSDSSQQLNVMGSPDLIAQLLDKFISNAIDFATPASPIIVSIVGHTEQITVSVENKGPLLPDNMQNNLFDSMVSVRDKGGKDPHLGLGLYIVRMISDFHGGVVSARNSKHNDGVRMSVNLPLFSA